MKLAITATLVCLAMTAPLLGQTATDPGSNPAPTTTPGMHPGGPRGPHGLGRFGPHRAGHRVQTISSAPFTAQFLETANFTGREGGQEQRTTTSTVSRDSQGRVREEITLPAPPPRPPSGAQSGNAPLPPATPRGPHTMITIFDPVAHTITHLNTERQTAYVQTVPADFFMHLQQREAERAAGQAEHPRGNATSTSLGSKTIAGVPATGEQTTSTFPARDGEAAHTMTHQVWYSTDLKLEVSSAETSDRGTRMDTLTSLNKAEPNPSLFQVPAGYTTSDVPERGGPGHHRGGPGGPGGPGSDDAPPPPPTM